MIDNRSDIDMDRFAQLVDDANCRSGACLSVTECLELVNCCCPREAIQKLKEMLSTNSFSMEELQDHITVLWLLYDLGKIQFPAKDIGLALSVQNIAKMEKTELASRLLRFLEKNLTFSD